MPESHPGIQFTRRKARRSAPARPSPDAGSAGKTAGQRAQTSPARYRQIAQSHPGYRHPTVWRKYTISGGRHPEKFVPSDRDRGQVESRVGSGDKQRVQRDQALRHLRAAVLSYIGGTPIGRGLEAGAATMLFDKVAPLLGRRGAPDVLFAGLPATKGGGKVLGEAPIGGDAVTLDTQLAKGLVPVLAPKKFRDAAGEVYLHELAHTRQEPSVGRAYGQNRAAHDFAEGGADAFAHAVAAIAGVHHDPHLKVGYADLERRFRKRYGLKGALHDQFPGAP